MANFLKFFISFRFLIVVLGWGFVATLPGLGFDTLSFAMTCMVNVSTNTTGQCSSEEFNWGKDLQATLFAGYSYGALCMVLFAGWFVDKLGPKKLMVASSTIALLSVALLPIAAKKGDWPAVLVLRIILGMAASPSWPVVARVASVWVHPDEKGTALGIGSTGFAAGSFVTNLVSGYLCCWKGWEAVFYFAAVGIAINLLLVCIFFSSSPSQSWWISEAELKYIDEGHETAGQGYLRAEKTPFLAIFTSIPVWVIFLNGFGERTIQFFTLMFMPTYLKDGLGVPTEKNGILSALPGIFQIIGRFASGVVSDKVKFSNSTTTNAKIYNTFAFLVVLAMLVANLFIKPGQEALVTVYMCIQFFFGSLVLAGYLRAAVMIAPSFSATIMGLSTFGAFLAAIVLPYYVKKLTPTTPDLEANLEHWHNVFYVIIVLVALSAVVFIVFGTTDIQKWARKESRTKSEPAHNELPIEEVTTERF